MLIAAIRHGQTTWNIKGRMQGRADIALSDDGTKEIKTLALPPATTDFQWYTSPLTRARETARLLGIKDPIEDERLIETNWGAWEGKTIPDLRAEYGDAYIDNEARGLDFRPPHGESPRDVRMRIYDFLTEKAEFEKQIGLVTHKGVIRTLLSLSFDWDMKTKAPEKLAWRRVHLFELNKDGTLCAIELNIPLAQNPNGSG